MLLFGLFLVILFIYFFKKEKKILNVNRTRIIQIIHVCSVVLVVSIIWMKPYDSSFRGYLTEKVIYWIFYFSALILLVFGNPAIIKGIQRIYYFIYLLIPLILVFTLAVPFLGLMLLVYLHTEFFGDPEAIKYSDSHFRLEMPFTGILGNNQSPVLIVKQGILEYEDQHLPEINVSEVDQYRISRQSKTVIRIQTKGTIFPNRKPATKTLEVHLKHPAN